MSLRSIFKQLWRPLDETRMRRLAARWSAYPASEKTSAQAIGRYAVACGATHGIHEACNFGCTACYLGRSANHQQPMPLEQVKAQLRVLADYLGPGGNVQITSGEVTLLPVKELAAIVAYARALGLSPMVMSHGDVLLHDPSYLDALVVSGGLRKLSLHVDTTQRGRRGLGRVDDEAELNGVREQMADMLRRCRQRTGVKLKAATTLTVNRRNLPDLGEVMSQFLKSLDCFRVISFQPEAATGRTPADLDQVDAEAVWRRLEAALGMRLNPHAFQFGHRDCNRIALILGVETGSGLRLVQAVRPDNEMDRTFVDRFMADFGGVVLNDRALPEMVARLLGVVLHKPRWLWRVGAYVVRRSWQERGHWRACTAALIQGRLRLRPIGIVVHAFMNQAQLDSEAGRQRLAACTFKVALDGAMVSMCEMNATPLREGSYQAATEGAEPAAAGSVLAGN